MSDTKTVYAVDETLTENEVNVYMDDCGATKLNCVTDCFGFLPLLTTQE